MATRRRRRGRGNGFPFVRAGIVMLLLWGTLWAAGVGGAAIGTMIYNDRYAPPAPYSEEQLRSMQRVAPEAASVAERDLELWVEGVEVGRSVARVEGALAGTMLLLAIWGTLAFVWMWGRERERAQRRLLDLPDPGEI